MAESKLLRRKIAAIRPLAALRPGAVMVAILMPDKTPADDIDNNDILWIKCPGSKTIATVLKAYGQRDSQTVRLIQRPHLLFDAQLVSSLVADDELCIIEAVREFDVPSRLRGESSSKSPIPMRDITNNAINQKPMSPTNHSKVVTPLPQYPASQTSIKPDIQIQPPTPSIHTSPAVSSSTPLSATASQHAVQHYPLLHLAWTDFTFERREHHGRRHNYPSQEMRLHIDSCNLREWQALNPNQRQFFVDRVQKNAWRDQTDHRAFWAYYYDILDIEQLRGNRPHGTFASTNHFFASRVADWKQRTETFFHFRDRVAPEISQWPVPSAPVGSSLPSQSPMSQSIAGTTADKVRSDTSSQASPQINQTSFSPLNEQPSSPTTDVTDGIAEALRLGDSAPARLNISELFDGLSTEQLEAGVAKGVKILVSIRERLESEKSPDTDQWLSVLSNVEKQATRTKTIVGVVGATGAGKSSVINAMLDEERLVPTNCMRACTAVVTEISYNYEEVPYRAEIEFINVQDWLKELKTSFDDLFDSNGKVSRECANEESEAGVAYAKIKAVYPSMTKEMMESTTIEKLMAHNNVKDLLGSERSIEDEDSLVFYKKLQRYVDSKEKVFSREKKTALEKAKAKEMEFWPLIRVVRLYVKAPALATGAVIVDLPGVHDSNQARAAVAQGYLKQCTGLWIVAPITRAVDDKSAKTLLGDSFKRQLKMDGGYNSVSFICSKTDDISITEAQDSLGLDEDFAPLYARSEELRKKKANMKSQVEKLRSSKSDINAVTDSADEQLEIWEKLQEDLESGKTVYAPKQESKKRKRSRSEERPNKKSKYTEDSDDDFVVDDEEDEAAAPSDKDNDSEDDDRGEPLTAEAIVEKITEFKTTKKEGRREKTSLEEKIRNLRSEISDISIEQDEIDGELSGKCIKGRNEYSRGAIQQDFASGIRELDQEIAEEEDAANFNPEVDARDYDVVAKSLPVFCVSSRGYQKLMGRLNKDKGLSSFRNVDETEIPALQAHCTKLTVATRETACKRFLNSLSQILNSLRLWSSGDGSSANLTDSQLKREAELLNSKLNKLDTDIERAIESVCSSFRKEIHDHLFDAFPAAINASKNKANDTQARWGAPIDHENRAEGGLYWATYKAVVRRDGTYTNNHFNDDLIEPLIKHVTPSWEKVFTRRLPQVLAGLDINIQKILLAFHNEVEKRAIKSGTSIAPFHMLRQQLSTYKETAKDAANLAKDLIVSRQKDVNREFVPVIMNSMLPAYAIATAERGPGSYKRMKDAMSQHVNQVRTNMFQDSAKNVQNLLERMLKDAEDAMLVKLDEVVLSTKRDYESVVIGKDRASKHDQLLPRQQRAMRKEVLSIVEGVELAMKRVVGLEPPEDTEQATESDDTVDLENSGSKTNDGPDAKAGSTDAAENPAEPDKKDQTSPSTAAENCSKASGGNGASSESKDEVVATVEESEQAVNPDQPVISDGEIDRAEHASSPSSPHEVATPTEDSNESASDGRSTET